MAIETNRITNANVYIDGTSLLGKVEEATLPDIKKVMVEHKALGLIGKPEFVAGLDKMEAKLKFNSIYPDVLKAAGGYGNSVKIQLRSSVEVYEAGSRTAQKPYVVFLVGQFTNLPAGGFKAMENVEFEANMSVTAVRIEFDRQELINVDVNANIWIVDGTDQLEEYRANLGI